MSLQALAWAIEDAPDVPKNCVAVLVALANRADEEGRGAFPSVHRLSHAARKSERSVQDDLRELKSKGLIREGDQRAAYHIEPRYRPVVWDLCMERKRDPYVTPRLQPAETRTDRKAKAAVRDAKNRTPGDTENRTPETEVRGAEIRETGVRETAPEPSLLTEHDYRERASLVSRGLGELDPSEQLPPSVTERPADAAPLVRCLVHLSDLAPPRCRDCKAARERHEAWAEKQRLRVAEAERRARAERARERELADEERRSCQLCGDDGVMVDHPLLCHHDVGENNRTVAARAEMLEVRRQMAERSEARRLAEEARRRKQADSVAQAEQAIAEAEAAAAARREPSEDGGTTKAVGA
jgi:hypothetical protein